MNRTSETSDISSGSVIVVGPLPPPRHGVAVVNETMVTLLRERGLNVIVCDTSVGSLSRSVFVRMGRVKKIFSARRAMRLLSWRNGMFNSVYMSMSGGWGLLYEAWLARFVTSRGARLVVHHNSYAYIDRPRMAMRLLVRCAGPDALHVAVDPKMAQVLRDIYGCKNRVFISNAAFITPTRTKFKIKESGCAIGFLCNLSLEKGLGDVLELARIAQEKRSSMQFHIAGPFEDVTVKRFFASGSAGLENVTYHGALYGTQKADFLQSLDAFVFPTRYRNEAEPLVVLEAMSAGCPVFATVRGAIPFLLSDGTGVVFETGKAFVRECFDAIYDRTGGGPVGVELRERVRARFESIQSHALENRTKLLNYLCGVIPLTALSNEH